MLKPLPFAEPDRLVGVWHTAPGLGIKLLNASPSTYFTYREENRVFEDIGLWSDGSVTVTGTAEPEQVDSVLFTDGMLPLLRVRPLLGRMLHCKGRYAGKSRDSDSLFAFPVQTI